MKLHLALSFLLSFPSAVAAADRKGKDKNLFSEKDKADCRLMMNQGLTECKGDDPSILIVGGVPAPINAYPWFVRLGNGCCGGSLISSQYVLSAAHCLSCIGVGTTAEIGAFKLPLSANGGQAMQSLTVAEAVGHPAYGTGGSDINFDYALLKLQGTATANPVKLDGDGVDVVADYTAAKTGLFPIGFGTTSSGGSVSNVLRHVDLNFVPQDTCAANYGSDPITDAMMCAADVGQDSCQGDSGGPLWDQEKATQVGVVSWGYGCAEAGYPGVYSRISTVFPWIRDTICADNPADPFCAGSPSQPTAAPVPCPGVTVGVDVTTDSYPAETSWKLTDNCQDGSPVVFERGSYTAADTPHSNEKCVTPAEFTFTIEDTFGDGICCGYGSGEYKVFVDGATEASGSKFDGSETHTFGNCGGPTAPVAPPTSPPVTADCVDDLTWRAKRTNKTCGWVAKKPGNRCNKKGVDGRRAWEACLVACDTCFGDYYYY